MKRGLTTEQSARIEANRLEALAKRQRAAAARAQQQQQQQPPLQQQQQPAEQPPAQPVWEAPQHKHKGADTPAQAPATVPANVPPCNARISAPQSADGETNHRSLPCKSGEITYLPQPPPTSHLPPRELTEC